MNWLEIEDKVVIVTGGSSGIGESIIKGLLDVGVKVINFDISDNGYEHENLMFVETDVSNSQNVDESVDKVVAEFGTIDGLVNNAGINIPRLLVDPKDPNGKYELSEEDFDRMLAINQKGTYLVSQSVGRVFVDKKDGIIINVSSEAGLEGSEGQSPYAGTKAAVYSYTRSWSKELGKHNIRVIGIAPGIMEETGLRTIEYEESLAYTRNITVDKLRAGYSDPSTTPLGRSGKLAEVADLTTYLLSERSGYITGVTINIAGGKTRG